MDIEKSNEELWHRLENEPKRAFEAFQTFLSLPSDSRTVVDAYSSHVDNPQAIKPSDTWARWSRDFAWSERGGAYDAHLDRIRERGIEKAIEAEAEMQAREAEKTRYRMNTLMALSFEQAMEWLENAQPSDLRTQDVLQIIRLHMDYLKAFEATEKPREEVTWTEEEEAELTQIIREIEAEEFPEEGADEDHAKEGEDGQN